MTDKPNTFVGLDMSGALTRCMIAAASGDELRYLGCGVMPPARWDDSDAGPRDFTPESVFEVIREAEEGAGVTISSAVVGVGSASVSSHLVHTGVSLPPGVQTVRPVDVRRVIEKAQLALGRTDTAALQLVPLEFIADTAGTLSDPIGHPANKLEAYVRTVAMRKSEHDGVGALVNEAGVSVEETVFGGYAAAFATLREKEMKDGVAHLEFGKTASSLTVFCRGGLRLATGLPIGRDDLVDDLARTLKTTDAIASSLIADFGRVEFNPGNGGVQVFVPGPDSKAPVASGAMRPCSLINRIITRRVQDCLQMVHEELRKLAIHGDKIRSLVLGGDMAALPGIDERARDLLSVSTRIGVPSKLRDLPTALQHPGWACAAGAVLYAHRLAHWQAEGTTTQEAHASGALQQGVRAS